MQNTSQKLAAVSCTLRSDSEQSLCNLLYFLSVFHATHPLVWNSINAKQGPQDSTGDGTG